MLWQFKSLDAHLALVTDPEAMKLNLMQLEVLLAYHQIALLTFDHVSGTVKRVHPIIGNWNVFFASREKIKEKL